VHLIDIAFAVRNYIENVNMCLSGMLSLCTFLIWPCQLTVWRKIW